MAEMVSYELIAETLPQTRVAMREEPETFYKLLEWRGENPPKERWSVTLPDKPIVHWISPNGTVWTLANRFIWDGPILWVRDLLGNQLAQVVPPFNLPGSTIDMPDEGRTEFEREQLVVEASLVVNLPSGMEQFRAVKNSGEVVRITLAPIQNGTFIPIVQTYPPGDTRESAFEQLAAGRRAGRLTLNELIEGKVPLAIILGQPDLRRKAVLFTYDQDRRRYGQDSRVVREERLLDRLPAHVARTPGGRILWFEFGMPWDRSPLAKVDVFHADGSLFSTINLLVLGRFTKGEQARLSLKFRDILVQTSSGWVPIEDTERSSSAEHECLLLEDRTGRQYSIEITPETVHAASMNLSKAVTKEPKYDPAWIVGSTTATSDDGQFEVALKHLLKDDTTQTQVTLFRNVVDPSRVKKQVQLWSIPIQGEVKSARVSNSGRAFCLLLGKIGERGYATLAAWEPDGGQIGGIDLVRTCGYSSSQEVQDNLAIERMTFTQEGIPAEIEIKGISTPTWPTEVATLQLNDGKTKTLFISNIASPRARMWAQQEPRSPDKPPGRIFG